MPTILWLGGFCVAIYPKDHRPAHVHVMGSGNEAVFYLNCFHGPVDLRENYGYTPREVTSIQKDLTPHLAKLCTSWEAIHGPAK